ncbi:MAG: ABC transporter ATP-binding protein [Armatimonadetes bacterium]|nr:ABC transporter ATP-binding protein [Armatimonadota bacterium]
MIACSGLGKRYGDRWLFRNVEFQVTTGECLVVVGRNGSGKSTLLKILAGLLPPTEGSRRVVGDPRTSLGYAALDQPVYPVLTVLEHLQLAADLRGVECDNKQLLEEVELGYAASTAGGNLSSGMRARLKLAMAIQCPVSVLLLDEPTAGLDATGQTMFKRVVDSRRATTALILATNDRRERSLATHEINLGL